jgi:hypothetical protein
MSKKGTLMKVRQVTIAASLAVFVSVTAQAQSYGAPGNDYVRQHPSGDRALWEYCQKHFRTDPRCYAVTRPGKGRRH